MVGEVCGGVCGGGVVFIAICSMEVALDNE